MHTVAKAALAALTTWIETGKAPIIAPRIDVAGGSTPKIVRNGDGIALGGIRTPPVDVPVATLSGAPGPTRPRSACWSDRPSRSRQRGCRSCTPLAPSICRSTTQPPTRRSRRVSCFRRIAPRYWPTPIPLQSLGKSSQDGGDRAPVDQKVYARHERRLG